MRRCWFSLRKVGMWLGPPPNFGRSACFHRSFWATWAFGITFSSVAKPSVGTLISTAKWILIAMCGFSERGRDCPIRDGAYLDVFGRVGLEWALLFLMGECDVRCQADYLEDLRFPSSVIYSPYYRFLFIICRRHPRSSERHD